MRCGKGSKNFKQYRRCRADTLEILPPLPFRIAEPHTNRICFRSADSPSVAVPVAGTGFPRDPFGTGKNTPERFIIGTHPLSQCFERQPCSAGRYGKDMFTGVPAPAACGVHKLCVGIYRFVERNLTATEDERQAVFVGRPRKSGKTAPLQIVEEMTDPVFTEHPDGGDI